MSSNTALPQVLEPSRTTPPPPEPLSGSERMVLWSSCAAIAKPTPTGPRNGPFGVNINKINAAAIAIVIVLGFICGFFIVAVLVRFLLRHRRPTRQHQNPPLGSRTPMPAAARSTSMPIEVDLNMPRPKMPDPDCSKPMAEQEEVPHQLPKRRRMSGGLFVEEEHISKRRKMSRDTSIEE